MKTLSVFFCAFLISTLFSQKLDKTVKIQPPRMEGSHLNVDSIYTVIHQTGDSILAAERLKVALIESEKKSLLLTIDILKKEVDIWKLAYYRKDYELANNLK